MKGVAGGTELRKEGCCWWYSSMVGRALLWYSSTEVKGVAGGKEEREGVAGGTEVRR